MLGAGLSQHGKRAGVAVSAESFADIDRVEARAVIQIHQLVIGMGAGLAVFCLDEVEDELLVLLNEVVQAQQDGGAVTLANAGARIVDGFLDVPGSGDREAKELLTAKRRVSLVLLTRAADIAGGRSV